MSWLWPDIPDRTAALRVAKPAFWVSVGSAVLFALGSGLIPGVGFLAIGLGTWRRKTGAVFAGLTCFCGFLIAMFLLVLSEPRAVFVLTIPFCFYTAVAVAYLRGLRGLQRFHEMESPSVAKSQAIFTPWLAIPLVIVLFQFPILTSTYFETSGQMGTTLLPGDRLVLERVTGWLRHSPSRGDLVAFRVWTDVSHIVIGRVVGLPNDRVRMVDKTLWINGQEVIEPYTVHDPDSVDTYRDNLPPQISSEDDEWRWDRSGLERHVSNGELVVPAGRYFVLGDSRDYAWDSRYEGFVTQDQIKGSPLFIYWSSEYDDFEGFGPIRWDRVAKRIPLYDLQVPD